MKAALLALALLAGCGGAYLQPRADAPLCPADRPDNYVIQGQQLPCRLRSGQRAIVQMPRANGSDEALQIICFRVFHGTVFSVNYGDWDYCGLPRVA